MRLHYHIESLHPTHRTIWSLGNVGHNISSKVKMAIYSGNKQIYRIFSKNVHILAQRQIHTHIVNFHFHTIHFSVSKHSLELLLVISNTICHCSVPQITERKRMWKN